MMNELADRLDSELVEFEKVVDRLLVAKRITRTPEYGKLADLLIVDRKKVIKALRFAADMETLRSFDVEIECGGQPRDEWLITVFYRGKVIQASDKCIYTAARKAVEELEKGEGDG